jgi:AbrB family looped-hinge helix DNA binding protein
MAESAIMSSKGQLVIPARLREELGLKPGVRVMIQRKGKGLLISPGAHATIAALCGKYAGLPIEKDLAELRREERSREDARLSAR